jgi:hypothetical protein
MPKLKKKYIYIYICVKRQTRLRSRSYTFVLASKAEASAKFRRQLGTPVYNMLKCHKIPQEAVTRNFGWRRVYTIPACSYTC